MAIPTRVIVEMRHEKASSAGTAKTLLSGEQSARPGRTLMREWRRVVGRQLVSGEQGCQEHHRAQLKARGRTQAHKPRQERLVMVNHSM